MRSSLLLAGALALSVGWYAYDASGSNKTEGRNGFEISGANPTNFACTVASITDGDTFRCSETGADGKQIRIRLSGVAARERDGSCTAGHPCPGATAEAATAELERLAGGQELSCRAVGSTYGRIAAFCSNEAGVDLSCAMVASGTAAKWDKHWQGHRC